MKRKTGPKPRPGRNKLPVACRPQSDVVNVLEARAAAYGVPRGTYLEVLICRALGMEDQAPDLPEIDDPQGAFDMTVA